MPDKQYLNPSTLYEPAGYTHIVTARGQRLIYISGQIPFNQNGELVGRGDIRAQAEQVYENLRLALEAANATFADVVKLNTYVVSSMVEARPILAEVRKRYLQNLAPPASTLVGVTTLAIDGLLLEIEAVAVTD